jgi:hypothetical protein
MKFIEQQINDTISPNNFDVFWWNKKKSIKKL